MLRTEKDLVKAVIQSTVTMTSEKVLKGIGVSYKMGALKCLLNG
jgi:hypothetical protein